MKPPDRDPISLGEAVAAVSKDLGMADPTVVSRIDAVWADVVGPALARHSQVRSLRDGECVVHVDSASWATQLRYLHDDLVQRLCAALGAGSVTLLKVAVRPPSGTDS
jgi:predicted nucleic acid-binding Zn ribbon protein